MYIKGKFAISVAVYYELSMLEKGLPRKCLIVQEKEKFVKLFHIEKCLENAPGAYVNLRDE